ncbi:SHOCT domain-containing protein [Agromyces humi]|uniref:SHOCT domain-containing protein n=1 Tax=Agromyces humi TaxID=1766800 RepID=UPI001357679F|nr:SHOCT domain-containing protein [Agromyces humi]
MGFFDSLLNNGRIDLPGVGRDAAFRAVIKAAAKCRFAVQQADVGAGFISMRAPSDYQRWDGNISATVEETENGALVTLAGAVQGWSIIGSKTASRGDLGLAQGKLDREIRRAAADTPPARKSPPAPGKAAAAPQAAAAARPTTGLPPGVNVADQVDKLFALFEKGAISKDEYEAAKRRVLEA